MHKELQQRYHIGEGLAMCLAKRPIDQGEVADLVAKEQLSHNLKLQKATERAEVLTLISLVSYRRLHRLGILGKDNCDTPSCPKYSRCDHYDIQALSYENSLSFRRDCVEA